MRASRNRRARQHEVRADEAGTAGDKPGLHAAFLWAFEKMDGQAAPDAYSSGFSRPWAEPAQPGIMGAN